jgi:hypothetical protein
VAPVGPVGPAFGATPVPDKEIVPGCGIALLLPKVSVALSALVVLGVNCTPIQHS